MTLRSSYPIYLSYQWNVFKLQISENLGFWNYNYIYLYHFNFYCSTIKFNFLTILTKASPYCSLCCQGNKIAFIVYKYLSNWYTTVVCILTTVWTVWLIYRSLKLLLWKYLHVFFFNCWCLSIDYRTNFIIFGLT